MKQPLRKADTIECLVLISPLGFGRISMIGRLLSTGAWWVNRLLQRGQPYPRLKVCLEEPDMYVFSGVRCDTLLVWGSKDMYFPLAHSARALKAIPNCSLRVLEGAGHAAHRSDTERFILSVQEFVGQHR